MINRVQYITVLSDHRNEYECVLISYTTINIHWWCTIHILVNIGCYLLSATRYIYKALDYLPLAQFKHIILAVWLKEVARRPSPKVCAHQPRVCVLGMGVQPFPDTLNLHIHGPSCTRHRRERTADMRSNNSRCWSMHVWGSSPEGGTVVACMFKNKCRNSPKMLRCSIK